MQIAKAAHDAADPLRSVSPSVATKPLTAVMIAHLIDGLDSDQALARITDWDAAAQRYLALVPLSQSWLALSQAPDPKLEASRMWLDELLNSLEFPPGFDSPRASTRPPSPRSRRSE